MTKQEIIEVLQMLHDEIQRPIRLKCERESWEIRKDAEECEAAMIHLDAIRAYLGIDAREME